ncbi:transmembrane protein 265-like [Centroberyx affinis]|uniref:transmembrane protein 265-like n=1 Tax=Centroberyx affinis TaxID=166261 RepID=UPI003A5C4BE3
MSHSHRTADEEDGLNTVAGSSEKADVQNGDTYIQVSTCCGQKVGSCCEDRDHRKLAIGSIICGISCIGIVALINSVKAREAGNPQKAEHFSRRARKFGVISIVSWLALLVLAPLLLALCSYLLTLID